MRNSQPFFTFLSHPFLKVNVPALPSSPPPLQAVQTPAPPGFMFQVLNHVEQAPTATLTEQNGHQPGPRAPSIPLVCGESGQVLRKARLTRRSWGISFF